MRFLSRIASGAVATAMLTATASAEGAAPQTTALLKFMPDEISAVRLLLARPVSLQASEDRDDRAALITFYGCSAAGPLWIDRTGLMPKAQAAMAELKKAADWGLNAADFKLPEPPAAGAPAMMAEQLADVEQKLSLAVLKYTRYAHGGRIPDPATQLSSYLDRKPVLPDAGGVLNALSVTGRPDAFLVKQHPRHPQFEKLRQEYLRLRDASSLATTYKIPAGRTLKPGVSHEQIALIRKRLEVPVPIVDGVPDDELYDPVLVAKVKDFQLKNDIDPANGVISDRTRKVLNAVDNKENVRRLLAAMEEWRWMPANLGDTYVWVNVPEFTVRVMKDGKAIHTERVVTGKANTQTPIFSDLMKTVVFQPQWGLPDSIKVNEILPRLRNGGGLRSDLRMQRNGRDVDPYNVNWERANILEYHVFQPSGDDNALGQVKFLFPNKHQVYMHDTPSKGLFRDSTRTFSHGCVRVRNPVKLAELLLAEDKGWESAKVKALVDDGPENNKIALDHKIPVHITYFTAVIGDDGKPQYFKDVYGHENRIVLATEGRWKEIVKTPNHLAPIVTPKGSREEVADSSRQRRKRTWASDDAAAYERRGYYPPVERRGPPQNSGSRYGLTRSPPPPPSFFGKIFGQF